MVRKKVRYVSHRGSTKKSRRTEKGEITAHLYRFPPLRISEPLWTLRLPVIVRGTGVYFKGARLFKEIVVGLCTTGPNGFRLPR